MSPRTKEFLIYGGGASALALVVWLLHQSRQSGGTYIGVDDPNLGAMPFSGVALNGGGPLDLASGLSLPTDSLQPITITSLNSPSAPASADDTPTAGSSLTFAAPAVTPMAAPAIVVPPLQPGGGGTASAPSSGGSSGTTANTNFTNLQAPPVPTTMVNSPAPSGGGDKPESSIPAPIAEQIPTAVGPSGSNTQGGFNLPGINMANVPYTIGPVLSDAQAKTIGETYSSTGSTPIERQSVPIPPGISPADALNQAEQAVPYNPNDPNWAQKFQEAYDSLIKNAGFHDANGNPIIPGSQTPESGAGDGGSNSSFGGVVNIIPGGYTGPSYVAQVSTSEPGFEQGPAFVGGYGGFSAIGGDAMFCQ